MSGEIRVVHEVGDRFEIAIRQHRLLVDQPKDAGGDDLASTPTELFVAGLASCVAYYAGRYLARHGLAADGLAVTASFEIAERPTRVGTISLEVHVPEGVPQERRDALLAVASHCTVHNSLEDPPQISIGLA